MADIANRLELWGGVECSFTRTGDSFRDQCALSGHYDRPDDIDRFAELGFTAMRQPILWERVAPADPQACDWRSTDRQLSQLREHGIRVIAGLVHHGSGPAYTNLLNDGFAPGLGDFAGKVAARYPWIEDWTPVNEPVTTARFSALYGHWYPHRRDEGAFWLALLNQIDGVRLAMRAVRCVNPAARLIQTDDLGRTYATLRLAEQATFDNLRRWAGWDLLFGRVTPHHPLWERIDRFDLGERLRRIADDPCPPDIVGVNHYLTSDRFIDHRLERYPTHLHGGNGRVSYADTEAIRVLDPAPAGFAGALREAWQRYEAPLALTEVHNGCTREEQLRWAAEAWDTAKALREDGVDIRAVTAWSLLGSKDWDTLLTGSGSYETGVWDVSSGTLRPTALAKLYAGLATDAPRHPVTAEPGWWRRPDRLVHARLARPSLLQRPAPGPASAILLICGDNAALKDAVAHACDRRSIAYVVAGPDHLQTACPWAVVNTSDLDDLNGSIALARACALRATSTVLFSSQAVVDMTAAPPRTLILWGELRDLNQAASTALDLLIDEAWGSWELDNTGSCQQADEDDGAYRRLPPPVAASS